MYATPSHESRCFRAYHDYSTGMYKGQRGSGIEEAEYMQQESCMATDMILTKAKKMI